MWIGAEGTGMGDETRSVGPLGNIQRASGAIESRVSAYDPTNAESADEAFNVNEFSYGTGDPLANVNALPTVSTWSHPDYMGELGPQLPAYSSDPENAAAAAAAAAQQKAIDQMMADETAARLAQKAAQSLALSRQYDDSMMRNFSLLDNPQVQAQAQALANLSAAGGMEFGGGGLLGEVDVPGGGGQRGMFGGEVGYGPGR